jgi:hypothetical protein
MYICNIKYNEMRNKMSRELKKQILLDGLSEMNDDGTSYIIADDEIRNDFLPAIGRYKDEYQIYINMYSPWKKYENVDDLIEEYLSYDNSSEVVDYILVDVLTFNQLRELSINEKIEKIKKTAPIGFYNDFYKNLELFGGTYVISDLHIKYLFGVAITDEKDGYYYVFLENKDGISISSVKYNVYGGKPFIPLITLMNEENYQNYINQEGNIIKYHLENNMKIIQHIISTQFNSCNYMKLYGKLFL